MHKQLRVLATLGGAAISLLLLATPAFAGTITSPASPFTVPGDATGTPQSFTVNGSGFTPGTQVYIEQCDGVSPTSAGWLPTEHCDLGTSPSARIVPASGNVTFPANDNNWGFQPFKGLSPQGMFTCGSATDTDPNDGLPFFKNCTVRISTSNANATADQAFVTLVLPDAETPPPSTPEAPFAILLPVGGVAAAGAFLFLKKRRAPSSIAA
ncbi:hypothetical protein BH10ACT1_BH10ACT1_05500 [soil metagenome]